MPDTKQLGVRINAKIASLLSAQAEKRGQSKKELIEKALLSYLDPTPHKRQCNDKGERAQTDKNPKEQIKINTADIVILKERLDVLETFKTNKEDDGNKVPEQAQGKLTHLLEHRKKIEAFGSHSHDSLSDNDKSFLKKTKRTQNESQTKK